MRRAPQSLVRGRLFSGRRVRLLCQQGALARLSAPGRPGARGPARTASGWAEGRRRAPGISRAPQSLVRGGYSPAAASARCARRARSTPARDSETSRRRAAFGSAEASQASVLSRVSWETWTVG